MAECVSGKLLVEPEPSTGKVFVAILASPQHLTTSKLMASENPKSFSLAGILYVVGLCVFMIAVSAYYKTDDEYCRYAAENKPVSEMAPECQAAAAELKASEASR
jgi:predicted histidine transporter YuiF (NhaC family)